MLSNLKKYQLILASNSPRRKELMSGLGVEYVVRTLPDVDESYPETLVGAAIPEYISREKAVGTILKMAVSEIGGSSLANAGNCLFV